MAGKLDIWNDALVLLGSEPVSGEDEETKEGRLLRLQWPLVLDEFITGHPWNFAIRRAELTQDTTSPVFGYANRFYLPTDPYCLRVLGMSESDYEYKVEGRRLLTDESTAKIKYLARIEEYNSWQALARAAAACRLAWKLALSLTGSQKTANAMLDQYLLIIGEARTMDAQEGTPEVFEATDWTDARL